jgi:hypothetical protein
MGGIRLTGKWRRLCNEELNNLYSSPSIIPVIKSRRMSWAGHVSCTRESTGAYRMLVGRLE